MQALMAKLSIQCDRLAADQRIGALVCLILAMAASLPSVTWPVPLSTSECCTITIAGRSCITILLTCPQGQQPFHIVNPEDLSSPRSTTSQSNSLIAVSLACFCLVDYPVYQQTQL